MAWAWAGRSRSRPAARVVARVEEEKSRELPLFTSARARTGPCPPRRTPTLRVTRAQAAARFQCRSGIDHGGNAFAGLRVTAHLALALCHHDHRAPAGDQPQLGPAHCQRTFQQLDDGLCHGDFPTCRDPRRLARRPTPASSISRPFGVGSRTFASLGRGCIRPSRALCLLRHANRPARWDQITRTATPRPWGRDLRSRGS